MVCDWVREAQYQLMEDVCVIKAEVSVDIVLHIGHLTYLIYLYILCVSLNWLLCFIHVLHSQRIRDKPLELWIIAEKSGRILGARCTCVAGLGRTCTHVERLILLHQRHTK